MPIAIRGRDRSGAPFHERTTSENLCRGGLAFSLSRDLELGATLEITIPLPRAGQKSETDFATRGEVRHVYFAGSSKIFGVAFTGPRFNRVFMPEAGAS